MRGSNTEHAVRISVESRGPMYRHFMIKQLLRSDRYMKRLSEKEIIDLFVSKFKNLNLTQTTNYIRRQYCTATRIGTDDVSIMSLERRLKKGVKLVFKCDMLVESTDVPSGMKPWQIARKSIVSCVSDFSAKGIKPIYISLLSLGIPERYSKGEILELLRGFEKSSREFGINLWRRHKRI